jgi:hypothetical protein
VGDTSLADQVFVKVLITGCTDVSDVSKRACEELGLGAGAPSRCRLYIVREGRERALAAEADPSLAAGILVAANKLAADELVAPRARAAARRGSRCVKTTSGGSSRALTHAPPPRIPHSHAP